MFTSKRFSFVWWLNWQVFLTCLSLSASYAVQLYTGLVDGGWDKFLLGTGAGVVELIKILALILANTAWFSALVIKETHLEQYNQGLFKKVSRQKIISDTNFFRTVTRYESLIRKASLMYTIYGFCALITISGSFGFILTQVDRHAVTAKVSTVTNSTVVDTNGDKIAQNKKTMASNDATVAENLLTIADLRAQKKAVDTLPFPKAVDDADLQARRQAERDRLQRKIQGLLDDNKALNANSTALSTENQGLAGSNTTLKKADETQEQARLRDVYELIGSALGQKNGEGVRLSLLTAFASIIEIGLFFFSPHLNSATETRTFLPPEKEEKTEEKVEEKVEAPKRKRSPRKPKAVVVAVEAPAPTPVAEEPAPVVEAFQWPRLPEVIEQGAQEDLTSDPELLALAEEVVVSNEEKKEWSVEAQAQAVAEVEARIVAQAQEPTPVEEPQPAPASDVAKQAEAFIDALFDSKDSYLVDKKEATTVADVTPALATKVFDFLVTYRRGAFNLIEFNSRSGKFYPRFTSEVVKKEVHDHLLVGLALRA